MFEVFCNLAMIFALIRYFEWNYSEPWTRHFPFPQQSPGLDFTKGSPHSQWFRVFQIIMLQRNSRNRSKLHIDVSLFDITISVKLFIGDIRVGIDFHPPFKNGNSIGISTTAMCWARERSVIEFTIARHNEEGRKCPWSVDISKEPFT